MAVYMTHDALQFSTGNLVAYGVMTILLYNKGEVIYRLFFHPVRQFPGPRLTAATYWYETHFDVFKAPGGQFIYELDRLHTIYGPVIRVNPEEIRVKDSAWFDTLYTGPGSVRDKASAPTAPTALRVLYHERLNMTYTAQGEELWIRSFPRKLS